MSICPYFLFFIRQNWEKPLALEKNRQNSKLSSDKHVENGEESKEKEEEEEVEEEEEENADEGEGEDKEEKK